MRLERKIVEGVQILGQTCKSNRISRYDFILYFDDTIFRGELKENGSFRVKLNATILSKRHQGAWLAVWGVFHLPPRYFDTFQSELLSVARSVAKFLRKLVNNILRAIKINFNECIAPLPCKLPSQYFVLGGKTRASRPHNFSQ